MQPTWRICLLAALAVSAAPGAAGLYELTTETGMPHLEENLRYAVTRTQRCLSRGDLGSMFPILEHPSLADCKLTERGQQDDSLFYVLVCEKSATTGTATWRLEERALRGVLEVKLGGKNMTFYQRVTGALIGECARDQSNRSLYRPRSLSPG